MEERIRGRNELVHVCELLLDLDAGRASRPNKAAAGQFVISANTPMYYIVPYKASTTHYRPHLLERG